MQCSIQKQRICDLVYKQKYFLREIFDVSVHVLVFEFYATLRVIFENSGSFTLC